MNLIDERGYFWWHKEKFPSTSLAPENGVYGRVTVDEKGVIELELDAHLPRQTHAIDLILNNELDVADIVGFLRSSSSYIFLGEAYSAGRVFGIGSLSHEKIRSHYCIISPENVFRSNKEKFISSIDLSFDGFDEWLGGMPLDIVETRSKYKVSYKKSKIQRENFSDKRISLVRKLHAPFSGFGAVRKINMTTETIMRVDKTNLLSPQDVIKFHGLFQDFMILLAGAEKSVQWPAVGVYRKKYKAKIYYWRGSYNNYAPTRSDPWIYFPQIQNSIGYLFNNWCQIRENYGPGVYLYLATRRGKELYNEHSFISLIWGLESLHRLAYPQIENLPLKQKIQRISEGITDKNDKKWFLKQSEYKAEPRLSDRLFDVVNSLNIGINEQEIKNFLEKCASARNEISHFGGERSPGVKKYDAEFLITARHVLGYLYHALLLKKIGVEENSIASALLNGTERYKFNHWLERAGLSPLARSNLR